MDLHVIILCIIIPLLTGWSMDMMLGDPEGLPHPVVFFGKWIACQSQICEWCDHKESPSILEYWITGGLFRFVRLFSFRSVLRIGKRLPS